MCKSGVEVLICTHDILAIAGFVFGGDGTVFELFCGKILMISYKIQSFLSLKHKLFRRKNSVHFDTNSVLDLTITEFMS